MSSGQTMPLGPVMVDVGGCTLNQTDLEHLKNPLVGAVILFTRNFKDRVQLTELITDIKSIRTPELLVCVDQEGGRVQRFRDGFTRLPAAAEIGKLWDGARQQGLLASAASGYLMAAELAETGLDFSFAPVLDVRSCESEVIGDRSFHTEPDVATELAAAYIDGMANAGMAATGKHFPGHGGVEADSHVDLPRDTRTMEALQGCDLVPFHELARDLQGIMTAHVLFEAIDEEIPTFSRYWLKEELRGRLGFEGVIFSDDLDMAGARQGDIVTCATRALDAGCDMVLICNAPETATELLEGLQHNETWGMPSEKNSAHLARMRRRNTGINRVDEARALLDSLGLI